MAALTLAPETVGATHVFRRCSDNSWCPIDGSPIVLKRSGDGHWRLYDFDDIVVGSPQTTSIHEENSEKLQSPVNLLEVNSNDANDMYAVILQAAKQRDAEASSKAQPKVTSDALDGDLPPRGLWEWGSKKHTLAFVDTTSSWLKRECNFQASLRPWSEMLDHLESFVGPFNGMICDIGCGGGAICSQFLSRSGTNVQMLGVDISPEMVFIAKEQNDDAEFLCVDASDMTMLPELQGALAGVWCSFTAAHFPGKKLEKAILQWSSLLQPGGWLCVVDLDGFFSVHRPFEESRYSIDFRQLDDDLQNVMQYDAFVGKRIAHACKKAKLKLLDEREWSEGTEFNFMGPGSNEQVEAWAMRMEREPLNKVFRKYFRNFDKAAKEQFLGCLRSKEHISRCKVKMVICQKPMN